MPNVSETRIAINLHDGASAGLHNLNSGFGRLTNTIQSSGSKLAQFNRQADGSNLSRLASNTDRAANSLSNMSKTLERLVYSASRYLVIYKALAGLGNVWDVVIGGSYEYAKSLETNQIGIAGILKSMVTLNGETIKWNDAMALSGKAMKSLQSEALRTAATSKELIETFRALLGPGLSSGMTIDQIVNLSTVGTNAVRSLGLPTNQYVQELRSIITEGIRPASSTLATSLGITNKDIKEAKQSAEGLYNFLMKRMEGFQDAVKYTSGTVEGRIARIQEGLNVGIAKGSEILYKSYSDVLEKIANYVIPVPEKLGQKWEINPDFVKGVETVADKISKLVTDMTEVGNTVKPFFGGAIGAGLTALDQVTDKLKYIIGFFAVKKAIPFVTDIANIATHSRNAYEAETALGRAIQAVSDKIHGRTEALRREAEAQLRVVETEKAYIAELSRVREIIAQQRVADKGLPVWKMNPVTDAWKAESLTTFVAKMRELGVEEERVNELARQYFNYLRKGTKEGAAAIEELIIAEEKEYQTKIKQINAEKDWGEKAQLSMATAGRYASSIGGLFMSFGILADVMAQADEENKAWYESAGSAAMQAGMFAMAIGSIVSAVAEMLPALARGIEMLRNFSLAKTVAGFGGWGVAGIAAGAAAVAGAAIYSGYKQYQAYENNEEVSVHDDWSDEDITYKKGNVPMQDIDDSDNYAIINGDNINYGQVATVEPVVGLRPEIGAGPSGGKAPKSRGGSKGRSQAEKKAESEARIRQILASTNKELMNMDDNATAYDKAMAAAKEKVLSYEKDIVKAEQRGVDVTEARQKQTELSLALEKKAWEAQEDEYLKFMKLEEESASQIHNLGLGTIDDQRQTLLERLNNHKAYLEELLAAEITNKVRRAKLEAELSSVVKQIKDESVYDFKRGWELALDEVASKRTNWAETFKGVFDNLETGMTDLIIEGGKVSDFFKSFFKSLLKQLTQILIRQMISVALQRMLGGVGGGAISVGDMGDMASNLPTGFTGGSLAIGGGIGVSGLATGGNVQAGHTYLVGERGPELLQLTNGGGTVYNNGQTREMLDNRPIVNIEIINNTNSQMKAREENSFDGAKQLKRIIIDTVSTAAYTNEGGFRDVIAGVRG